MLSLLALMACTPDPPHGAASHLGQVTIDVGDAARIDRGDGEFDWGTSLVAGCDLDHDGRLEWAVGAPRFGDDQSPYAVVRVFEGEDEVTDRNPVIDRPEEHGNYLAAGEDVNGDGYPDLTFTTASGSLDRGSRATVAFDTDRRNDWAIELDVPGKAPKGVRFARVEGGRSGLVFARNDRWDVYVDTFEPGQTVLTDGATLIDSFEPPTPIAGTIFTTDLDGDGVDEVISGAVATRGTIDHELVGVYACPVEAGLDVPTECVAMRAESESIGSYQTAGDLDGDGVPEIVSSKSGINGADGSATVFRADGTELAVIEGSHGAMFGRSPTYVMDDQGVGWLLVSQVNLSGDDPGTVWAFRGDRLVGHLIEEDADRVYTGPGRSLGTAIATYRETPLDPLMLLLGSPGEGTVYMLPFDP